MTYIAFPPSGKNTNRGHTPRKGGWITMTVKDPPGCLNWPQPRGGSCCHSSRFLYLHCVSRMYSSRCESSVFNSWWIQFHPIVDYYLTVNCNYTVTPWFFDMSLHVSSCFMKNSTRNRRNSTRISHPTCERTQLRRLFSGGDGTCALRHAVAMLSVDLTLDPLGR